MWVLISDSNQTESNCLSRARGDNSNQPYSLLSLGTETCNMRANSTVLGHQKSKKWAGPFHQMHLMWHIWRHVRSDFGVNTRCDTGLKRGLMQHFVSHRHLLAAIGRHFRSWWGVNCYAISEKYVLTVPLYELQYKLQPFYLYHPDHNGPPPLLGQTSWLV